MLTASIALAVYCLSMQRPVQPPDCLPAPQAVSAPGTPALVDGDVMALLANNKTRFELLDERGGRHKASLVRRDGDSVVLRSGAQVVTLPAAQLRRAERRGDNPWDGALIGAGSGFLAWYLFVNPFSGEDWQGNPCTMTATNCSPTAFGAEALAAMVSVGAATGLIVDLLHVSKHQVLVGPMRAATRRPPALTLAFTGPSRERRLQIGYRVIF